MTAAPGRPGRILVLGCGSVGQCTIPLLVRELDVDPSTITVVDPIDNRARIGDSLAAGVRYELAELTRDNLDSFLSERVGPGDMLLDLAWNIDNPTIVDWCHRHEVRYLNTSVELWDPYTDAESTHPLDRTLYVRHMALRRTRDSWPDRGPTAIVEHGANPGLISHFAKQALTDIASRMLADGIGSPELQAALDERRYAHVAMLTGTKVIHIAERDTQVSSVPKEPNEFVNTWSVEGFHEEGIAPAEIGWGTHERTLPADAYVHADDGPCNQICIARPGMEVWVRSVVPSGEIRGMVIRHGEAFTMSEHLTVRDDSGAVIYRPTVHYAYLPTDAAIASVLELRMRNWEIQPRERILNDEITAGRDELGVLLMGHPYTAWWTGSRLSIEEARAVLPHQNATTLQVAASVVAAVTWMIANPNEGLCVPDDLPWEEILRVATPFLGTMHSGPIEWDPLSTRHDLFGPYNDERKALDPADPWQFANFLVP